MRPPRPPSSSDTPWWLLAIAVAIIIVLFGAWRAGVFGSDRGLLPRYPGARPTAPAAGDDGAARPSTIGPAVVAPTEDASGPGAENTPEQASPDTPPVPAGPRYPVPVLDPQARAAAPLPEPGIASDPPLARALAVFGDRGTLSNFFNLQDIARRFVITVDNLPRRIVPTQHSALRRIPGQFEVVPAGDGFELAAGNEFRYRAFLGFAEALDPGTIADLYVRFYPLLQYEYEQMGFPEGHLNDRVIAAIDDMLAAPTPAGPIRLVQPRVLYRYADPALESLSAGQKVMVRIGPDNAQRLRVILKRLRAVLATLDKRRPQGG